MKTLDQFKNSVRVGVKLAKFADYGRFFFSLHESHPNHTVISEENINFTVT